MHDEMTVLPDGEISFTPTGDIVKLGGVRCGPAIGWFTNLGACAGDFGGQSVCLLVCGSIPPLN
jgi:hypothetical protein